MWSAIVAVPGGYFLYLIFLVFEMIHKNHVYLENCTWPMSTITLKYSLCIVTVCCWLGSYIEWQVIDTEKELYYSANIEYTYKHKGLTWLPATVCPASCRLQLAANGSGSGSGSAGCSWYKTHTHTFNTYNSAILLIHIWIWMKHLAQLLFAVKFVETATKIHTYKNRN